MRVCQWMNLPYPPVIYSVAFRKKPFVFVVFYAFHSLFSCLTLWQKSISFQWWKIYVIIMKYVEVMTLNVRLPHFVHTFPHFHQISRNSATAKSFTSKLEMYEWPKSLVLTVLLTSFGSCTAYFIFRKTYVLISSLYMYMFFCFISLS